MLGRVIRGDRITLDPLTGEEHAPENLAQFSYYGDSYQVRKRSTRQAATDTHESSLPFYAGDSVVADMNDNGLAAPTLQTEYLTAGPVGIDEILAQYTPADLAPGGFAQSATHPVQDVNRRVFMTVKNAVGQPTAITERALYTAFGERTILTQQTQLGQYENRWLPTGFVDPLNPTQPASDAPNAFSQPKSAAGQTMGFQGRRHEDLPGVMNFRNRLYDARLGRFLERDPLVDENNPSAYAFEANNPTNALDPMGTSLIVSDEGRAKYLVKHFKELGFDADDIRFVNSEDVNGGYHNGFKVALLAMPSKLQDLLSKLSPYDREMAEKALISSPDYVARGGDYTEVKIQKSEFEAGAVAAKEGVRAVGNAAVDTVVSTVTVGQVDGLNAFGEIQDKYAATYSYGLARAGTETLMGVATGGLSKLSTVGKLGKVVKATTATLNTLDTAQNVIKVVEGSADIAENGLTWENSLQVLGSLGGLKGNSAGDVVKVKPKPGKTFSGMPGLDDLEIGPLGKTKNSAVPASPGVPNKRVTESVGDLRAAGKKDAHHVIQDASVRDIPGYKTNAAPGVQLEGPSTLKGSRHYNATQAQRAFGGGGTYGSERVRGYVALRRGGFDVKSARKAIDEADEYFGGLGVDKNTRLRLPGGQ